MNFVRQAAAVLTTTTLVGGLLVFDVVGVSGPTASPVVPSVRTLALAGEMDSASTEPVASAEPSAAPSVAANVPQEMSVVEDGSFTSAPLETDEFTVVGVTWDSGSAAADELAVQVRTRGDDGWSRWTELEAMDAAPHPGTEEAELVGATVGTEPMTTDAADALQVRVTPADGELPDDLNAVAIDPGQSPADEAVQDVQPLVGADANARPAVVTRSQWGADESRRKCNPSYSSTVQAGAVHHTAGSNSYTKAQAAGVVRGIYAYHTGSLGWCDVGYNFLVDKFGTIYEGRHGGMDRAVRGAHSGGFNDRTFGVAAIGNFETASAPTAMVQAMGRIIGWKLGLTGRRSTDTVSLTSAGGGTSKFPAGRVVSMSAIFAHRDVGQTACPGRNLMSSMGSLRSAASAAGGTPSSGPSVPPSTGDLPRSGNRWAALEVDGTSGDELLAYHRSSRNANVVDVSRAGAPTPLGSGTWASWDVVVPVEVDGTSGDELLLYDTIGGRQVLVDLDKAGRVTRTLSETRWSQWDIVVPVEVDGTSGDELLLYDTRSGRQAVVNLSRTGMASKPLSQTTWSRWNVVVPVEVDGTSGDELLVYDTRTGRQAVVDLSRTGRASKPLSETTWSIWDTVVAVELDGTPGSELIVYDSRSGRQAAVDLNRTGRASRALSSSSWSKWDDVVELEFDGTVRSELMVSNSATGNQRFLDLDATGTAVTLFSR